MDKCCINGCDSHKHIGDKNIGFFPFPMHDDILMKKWLAQINLPDWKPGAHHRICSMHFYTKDVDSHPNRKQPFLNPISVPTIFPERYSGPAISHRQEEPTITLETQNPQPLQTAKINDNGGYDISILQSVPVFLIPVQSNVQNAMHISTQYTTQITMQNQSTADKSAPIILQESKRLQELPNPSATQTEESSRELVQQWPIVQSRLRKILPKPDFLIIPNIDDLPTVSNILRSTSSPKLDVQIVHNIANYAPNDSPITCPSYYPGKMRAVLRISINKHRTSERPNDEPMDISSDETEKDGATNQTNLSGKEITIENTSTNRVVTFRLDPKSGEIAVTTQQIDDSLIDEEHEETTRTERKVDYACNQPSAANLRQLYTKSQRECNVLRKRLKLLRQRHREEQEEIEKLREHLTQIGDRVQTTCREDTLESRDTKRTEDANSVRSSNDDDDDYEKVLRKVKKTRREFRITRTDLSAISNGQLEVQRSIQKLAGNNADFGLLEDKSYSPKIMLSSDEKIRRYINYRYK